MGMGLAQIHPAVMYKAIHEVMGLTFSRTIAQIPTTLNLTITAHQGIITLIQARLATAVFWTTDGN
jgi:hypothetical protein